MIYLKRFGLFLALFVAVGATLSAQQIPVNIGSLDYIGQWDRELQDLIGGPLPILINMGRSVLDDSVVLLLVLGGLQYGFIAGFNIAGYLWNLLLRYSILSLCLSSYSTPLPWFGVSFHQLVPHLAQTIRSMIDLSSANLLMAQLDQIRAGLAANPANPANLLNGLISLGISMDAAVLYALSFGVALVGWAMIGFLSLVGPIALGFALLPPLEFILSGWIRSIFAYSFFGVAQSAAVFMSTRMLLFFLNKTLHGDFSVAHFAFIFPFFLALTLIFVMLSLLAFVGARDVFHGTAGMSNPLSSVARFAAAVV